MGLCCARIRPDCSTVPSQGYTEVFIVMSQATGYCLASRDSTLAGSWHISCTETMQNYTVKEARSIALYVFAHRAAVLTDMMKLRTDLVLYMKVC